MNWRKKICNNREMKELIDSLPTENRRLVALLEQPGLEWRKSPPPVQLVAIAPPENKSTASKMSTEEKVALFRNLFKGRTDRHPIRWKSSTRGRSGYVPACANEWRAVNNTKKTGFLDV